MPKINFAVGYRTVLLFVIALSLWTTSLANASEERRGLHRVAVIVSNESYKNFADAKYAYRDGEDFTRYLISVRGFQEKEIIRRYDATKPLLDSAFGSDANHAGLISTLVKRTNGSTNADIVVFYSGNGILIAGKLYLLPSDADAAPKHADLYPIETLYGNMARISARVTMVLYIDTWFGEGPGASPSNDTLILQENTLTVLITSSGASANEQAGHEVFKRALLDGVYGDADNEGDRDGAVSLQELTHYLRGLYEKSALGDKDELEAAWRRTVFAPGQNEDVVLATAVDGIFPRREPLGPNWTSDHLTLRDKTMKSECPDDISEFLKSTLHWQYTNDAENTIGDLVEAHRHEVDALKNQRDIEGLNEYSTRKSSCASFSNDATAEVENILRQIVRECRDQSPRFSDCEDRCPKMIVVDRSLAVGKYEITRDEFGRYANGLASGEDDESHCWTYVKEGDSGRWARRTASWENPGLSQDRLHPVTCVNWNDAKEYTLWLNEITGMTKESNYRLPKKSEWLSVAGMSDGNEAVRDSVQHSSDQAARSRDSQEAVGTVDVRSGVANDSGLHHMRGNVWEWVEDCWQNQSECQRRILLGGSWWDLIEPPPKEASGIVGRNYHEYRLSINGFRVVRDLVSPDDLNESQLREELRSITEPVPEACRLPETQQS